MNGLLVDVNLQGHLPYLLRVMDQLGLLEFLQDQRFATFPEVGLPPASNDRLVWNYCQTNALVLLTDNRNRDGIDSLESTLIDSARTDCFPVVTISNKDEFERSPEYAERVAKSVAEILYGLANDIRYRGIPRLYVPSPSPG